MFQIIQKYHEATKHHFHRYARSAGFMDWNNQPNPFRYYEGAPLTKLPLGLPDSRMPYADLFEQSGGPEPLNAAALSRFMRFSLGLSAWKAAGRSSWSLRINPSSGNLHPTEGHLVLPAADELKSGLYHYNPLQHALEQRASVPEDLIHLLSQHLGGSGFMVALTSIYWREAWKYGERAFRYCNLDVGHALAALALAARMNHWRLWPLTDLGDAQIRRLLGLDRTAWPHLQEEEPELLAWVYTTSGAPDDPPRGLPMELIETFDRIPLQGRPNPLSAKVRDWRIIQEVSAAAKKPPTHHRVLLPRGKTRTVVPPPQKPTAETVIRQRRSATDFDSRLTLSEEKFYAILARTLPEADTTPFEAAPGPPRTNLLLFVHRIQNLPPGLYLLGRAPQQLERLRPLCRTDFEWAAVHPDLPLFRLWSGDVSYDAMELSCHQEIAANGVFAVSMLVPFRTLLAQAPYAYRHLFWECGMIGQMLYLEAEAQGLRGTGIGCYFDDPVHERLGLTDDRFQCFYHFTIGYPAEDHRLTTLSGYHHLK